MAVDRGLVVRPITDDELDAFVRTDSTAFGTTPDEHAVDDVRRWLDLERTRAVFDGARLVGASATIAFQLTLPGLTIAPAAGVSWVGVAPTHRRRGVMRAMMESLLDDAVRRGEPLSILTASESHLYGRFGFGPATARWSWEIDRHHAALVGADDDDGTIELVDADAAATVLPSVFDEARRRRPGDLDRSSAWWAIHLRVRPGPGRMGGACFHVVHRRRGVADGYATYGVDTRWDHGLPRGRLVVQEVIALDVGAEVSLWRYLLGMDLTEVVTAGNRPVDDPLRWMLADPRRLRTTGLRDELWLRVLDVPAALAARRYGTEAEIVVEVVDGGRFRLNGGQEAAACEATGSSPDLELGLGDLGSLYLGGVAPSTLAAAGRVREHRRGALARADAMFVSHLAPFSRSHF